MVVIPVATTASAASMTWVMSRETGRPEAVSRRLKSQGRQIPPRAVIASTSGLTTPISATLVPSSNIQQPGDRRVAGARPDVRRTGGEDDLLGVR